MGKIRDIWGQDCDFGECVHKVSSVVDNTHRRVYYQRHVVRHFMAKPIPHAPSDKVALYEKLVAANPNVERKGAANPYTSVNGNMFSQLMPSGRLSLRLPADERETFLKKYKTKLVEQYGVVMKEYVEVPDALLAKTSEIKKYFDTSYQYASSLKPKPTKKTK